MYLETASVQVIQPEGESGTAIARQVIRLLATEDWVRCIGTAAETNIQYTVMARTENGTPLTVAYKDHYGNLGTVSL